VKVPLLDLKLQYGSIKAEILKTVEELFETQQFIMGPHVDALERQMEKYCGVSHAIGVSSGTDALLLCLMAAGIGPGDRVLTTPYTFFATAGSIVRLGAVPVFADIDPATYNICPEKAREAISQMAVEERDRLKAVIPVHLFGRCAEMDPILGIARERGLVVIEDAAQAIGSEYRGRRAGSMGDYGCFSFFPSKNLGAFGDGGMVTTVSEEENEKIRILRVHGSHPKYVHRMVGGNFRLDALQAAVVSVKMKYLDRWTEARQRNARRYGKMFADAGLDGLIRLPVAGADRHVFNQYVIEVPEKRDELRHSLAGEGIGTEVYYPVPMHLQPCFASLGFGPGAFPRAEHAALHSLALPVYPEITEDQQAYVVEKIHNFCV
jgi:dTDP-4-amino-4,6-dideoxygalactose transaminase